MMGNQKSTFFILALGIGIGLFYLGATTPSMDLTPLPDQEHEQEGLLSGFANWSLESLRPSSEIDESQEKTEAPLLSTKEILSDPENRISEDFKTPEDLAQRVEFWFQIYSHYGKHHHVIHHTRFPWIVYEVVDVGPLIVGQKGPLWMRRQKAERHVKKRKREIRALIRKKSRLKRSEILASDEPWMKEILKLPGDPRVHLKRAKKRVRSQLGQRDFFSQGLRKSDAYLPEMERIFREKGIPTELTRVPFVESSFNVDARSKVGASGIWQIMPRTGRQLMKVNRYIDERNSPIKATLAAAKVFRLYQKILNSWPLTITSYNHGVGNIKKAIRAAKSRDLATIISRYHKGHFRFASANFYSCVIAAIHAEKYREILFPEVKKEISPQLDKLKLSRSQRFGDILKASRLDRKTFFQLNQDLNQRISKNFRLPKNFEIYLLRQNNSDRSGVDQNLSSQ